MSRLEATTASTERNSDTLFTLSQLPEYVILSDARESLRMDRETIDLLQLERLHETINHTHSRIGSLTLLSSLLKPPVSLDLIHAKQESYQELADNAELRNGLSDFLEKFAYAENGLCDVMEDNLSFRLFDFYPTIRKALFAGKHMGDGLQNLPMPESPYLQQQLTSLGEFSETRSYRLMRGPIYRGVKGLKTAEDNMLFEPLRFRPKNLTIGTAIVNAPALYVIANTLRASFDRNITISEEQFLLYVFFMYSTMITGQYPITIKKGLDMRTIVRPLRKEVLGEERFFAALSAVGKLDELSSFVDWASGSPYQTTVPTVTDEAHHHMRAEQLHNPILARTEGASVPIDIELDDQRLTFVTGPVSGGKTTFGMTVAQSQIMAQAGSPIVAEHAEVNIADHIAYQVPKFSALEDKKGRFAIELERVKGIFFTTTPRSLVFLDELGEGTTTEEKQIYAQSVLDGFNTIGNTTIFITHNHELADQFQGKETGQFLQVGFEEHKPTYQLDPGISHESHALQVAEDLGFSPEDIRGYLREKGYL